MALRVRSAKESMTGCCKLRRRSCNISDKHTPYNWCSAAVGEANLSMRFGRAYPEEHAPGCSATVGELNLSMRFGRAYPEEHTPGCSATVGEPNLSMRLLRAYPEAPRMQWANQISQLAADDRDPRRLWMDGARKLCSTFTLPLRFIPICFKASTLERLTFASHLPSRCHEDLSPCEE